MCEFQKEFLSFQGLNIATTKDLEYRIAKEEYYLATNFC